MQVFLDGVKPDVLRAFVDLVYQGVCNVNKVDSFDHELLTHRIGGVHNHDLQNFKWKSLWLYMRLLDVKRFFENFAVLILPRPNYFLTHPI